MNVSSLSQPELFQRVLQSSVAFGREQLLASFFRVVFNTVRFVELRLLRRSLTERKLGGILKLPRQKGHLYAVCWALSTRHTKHKLPGLMEGDGRSRIPSLLRRSASVRVRGERHAAAPPCCSHPSADGDSVGSTASLVSCGSTTGRPAGQQSAATSVETAVSCHRRGSCRSVLHCQRPVETDNYLTPTQRKDRELRQLRAALARATTEARLRDERLRELTAQLQSLQTSQGLSVEGSSVEERAAEGVSLGDSGISSDVLPSHTESVPEEVPEMEGGDEGSTGPQAAATSGLPECQAVSGESDDSTESFPEEEATRRHPSAGSETLRRKYRQLKHRYEQRTESLLQMLGDLNANTAERQPPPCEQQGPSASRRADALWQHVSTCQSTCITRYLELRPAYESTQERLRHLERELSEARAEIEKQERWHSEMYLKMYRKGQEAAQFERNEELQHRTEAASPSALPAFRGVPGTERQAEYTLRFLKDAVYYFLTDRSDCRGHLSAIQSILGFSEAERAAVAKAWRHRGRL
ncbi:protein quick-to-court isoform X3 [Dermacentor albipictus]|uniref:protein quick-to-court isoform X3 n=1 Tax=Dermacentor albipictus TaxID=60249 RepID=UPI0038FCDE84